MHALKFRNLESLRKSFVDIAMAFLKTEYMYSTNSKYYLKYSSFGKTITIYIQENLVAVGSIATMKFDSKEREAPTLS